MWSIYSKTHPSKYRASVSKGYACYIRRAILLFLENETESGRANELIKKKQWNQRWDREG